jgi:hypothetical protein
MMKNFRIFALMGAVALTSALAFTSCKKDKTDSEVSGGAKEEVKTQFSIAMPTVNSGRAYGPKKMQGTNVQSTDGDFLGMEDMYLLPFASTATSPAEPILAGETAIGNRIDLDNNTLGSAALDKINKTTQKAKYYANVSVPIGTRSFLFYAHSPEAGSEPHFVKGHLTAPSFSGNVAVNSLHFDPTPIISSDNLAGRSSAGDKLLGYLNKIVKATGWSACSSSSLDSREIQLALLYDSLTNSQYFGGSSANVQAAVRDLYTSVFPWTDAVSRAIKDSILLTGYASDAGSTGNITFDPSLDGFPADIYMPDGSVVLACSGTPKQFSFATTNMLKNAQFATPGKIAYPPSLWYRTNSIIRTSNSSHKSDYDSQSTWAGLLATYTDNTGVVARATRSVAIEYPIQYAVARLELTVKTKDASALEDNHLLYPNYPAGPFVDVPTVAAGYPLTGVFVGGQKSVDFQFHQIESGEPNYTGEIYTIYDKDVVGVEARQNTAIGTNHTLVFETAANQDIYVALEFTNNSGRDFYGRNGIVPAGCKFYLVALLTASEATETGSQVFKQDFVTKANFTIQDLAKAYNTIPDLRSSELELGMTVNLQWQNGHTFNISEWQ